MQYRLETIRQRLGYLTSWNQDVLVGALHAVLHTDDRLYVTASDAGIYCFVMETEKAAEDLTILFNMGISMRIEQ